MIINYISSAQTDVHCHMIPESYLSAVKAHGMEMDEGFPIPGWSADAHLAFMDEAGIGTAVLTMPAPQPYFGDGAQSAAICREFNEEAAALKALHPGRFLFCAALPLPDVDKALEEAEYALEVLGADGVKLASNSYGQYLGDPDLDPLMAYLNDRKAVIITHPHKPSAVNEKLIDTVPLASYEYLAETTRAILNMVAHDVLVRYPDLKVVVPHCGSFLPNALPRFKGLLPVMVKQGYMQPVDVDANISRLYFDLAEALDNGLTVSEAKEALSQLYAYTGFPRSLNALGTLQRVLTARQAAGIQDDPGKDADPLPADYDALKQGTAVQTQLSGKPFNYGFVPATVYYLKAHLFGDIFARNNLGFADREIVTVSAISALPGCEPQLVAHVSGARNMGVTDAELRALPALLEEKVGLAEAERLREALKAGSH